MFNSIEKLTWQEGHSPPSPLISAAPDDKHEKQILETVRYNTVCLKLSVQIKSSDKPRCHWHWTHRSFTNQSPAIYPRQRVQRYEARSYEGHKDIIDRAANRRHGTWANPFLIFHSTNQSSRYNWTMYHLFSDSDTLLIKQISYFEHWFLPQCVCHY